MTALLFAALALAQDPEAAPPTYDYDVADQSYALGVDVARSFLGQDLELDVKAFQKAFAATMAEKTLKMDDDTVQAALMALQTATMARQEAKRAEQAAANAAAGEAFLATNGARPEVTTTESGLQYEVLTQGPDGPKPTAASTVTVHYRGTLIDGTEFDSSYGRGEPATFPLMGVIPGWTEALQLMKAGDKFKIALPSGIAYGDRGAGELIGPGAVLVFEVELLEFETPAPPEAPPIEPPATE
jgi:FKBP-type peptidyl-prolyl cis-trans isomerase FklB